MPQFKRFVAYLYYYENDTKEYLAGFAKVEMRGGICRLEIHLKGTEYAGQEGKVSLFIRREGKILTFPVGSMRLMSQRRAWGRNLSHAGCMRNTDSAGRWKFLWKPVGRWRNT